MYWPSVSSGSQYVYEYADKPILSADGMLQTYDDWTDIQSWPEVPGASSLQTKLAAKQGDPTQKRGVVGAFCREYDIHSAIDAFLPNIYTPVDDDSGRYTYIDGSTVGGAVTYDDGAFLYSHHATDPCSAKLVNAFDLIRLHKFGEQDDDVKPDTPVNKFPSYVSMSSFALNDVGVAAIMNQERYESAVQDFGDSMNDQKPAKEIDTQWIRELKLNLQRGSLRNQ